MQVNRQPLAAELRQNAPCERRKRRRDVLPSPSPATTRSIARRWKAEPLARRTRKCGEGGDRDGPRIEKKRSVRTENRAGNPAFLARAQGAVDGLCKLLTRIGPPQSKVEAPDGEPIPAEALEEDGLPNMTMISPAPWRARVPRKSSAAKRPQTATIHRRPRRLLTKRHKRCRKQVALIPSIATMAPDCREKGRKSSGISMEWDPLETAPITDEQYSKDGQSAFSAGFRGRGLLPLEDSSFTIRGETERQNLEVDLACPISIAEPRLGSAPEKGRMTKTRQRNKFRSTNVAGLLPRRGSVS